MLQTHAVLAQLTQLGIKAPKTLYYNPDYDTLFQHELSPDAQGYERGVLTQLGAVSVDTGHFTGRSPKDKYVVKDGNTESTVWWKDQGSDNQAMSPEVWVSVKNTCLSQLEGKTLYVMDGFCGANPATRLQVRLVTEVAWMAHFFKNMFIRPSPEEQVHFVPDWTILNACKTSITHYQALGLQSEVAVAFNFTERMTLIAGTWYGGEIKKGIFSVMNYFLPLQGIGSFHCSANEGEAKDTALFFGLSGTGKTTLSADPKRALIGDDEHGWDDEGVFNLEGGCYAKTINLSLQNEPDIYRAIRRNALLENVVVDAKGNIDFSSSAKTENTRVSYPIDHILNIVKPVSRGRHPNKIIFLTCDAYGVLPPVAKLSKEQAMYQYLSGYTAKIAGTELGVKEPTATFSACFGQAFLMLPPTQYAEILGQKMHMHQTEAYLVNTGWSGGPYGVGKRISIQATRAIIDAILSGSIKQASTEVFPYFGFEVPTAIVGVESQMLQARQTWADPIAYDQALQTLAQKFVNNFAKFAALPSAKQLAKYGPHLA